MATIKGKWIWADAIESNLESGYVIEATIPFVSNRESFSGLYIQGFAIPSHVNIQYGGMNGILVTRHQLNENNEVILCKILETYRVMDFGEGGEINDEVYNFIVEHATPYTYTVSEKLEIIAKNEKAVYQSGYDKALEKGGYNKGFEDGRGAFWDSVFSGEDWRYRFAGSSWNDDTFYPNQNIKPTGNAQSLFSMCEITDLAGRLGECGVTLDTSGITTNCSRMFEECGELTTVPYLDLRNVNFSLGVLYYMFPYCYNLKTIEGIHLAENGKQTIGSSAFYNCTALEDITFYGAIGDTISFKQSTLLTRPSIESIVNHLSDTASGKTLTLSITAVATAFGGGAFDSDGDGKNDTVMGSGDWVDLVNSKPNWKITLV